MISDSHLEREGGNDNIDLYLCPVPLQQWWLRNSSYALCLRNDKPANHEGPCCFQSFRGKSQLHPSSRRTPSWLPCLPASIKPQVPFLFFEIFIINEHLPYWNSLNKIISLIVWCILSFIAYIWNSGTPFLSVPYLPTHHTHAYSNKKEFCSISQIGQLSLPSEHLLLSETFMQGAY